MSEESNKYGVNYPENAFNKDFGVLNKAFAQLSEDLVEDVRTETREKLARLQITLYRANKITKRDDPATLAEINTLITELKKIRNEFKPEATPS